MVPARLSRPTRMPDRQRVAVLLRGAIDITIEDMVLTAATLPAVLAEQAQLLRIDRNRVAMKNVRSLWPAIYASGSEIHIDRNWVGIQSAANVREWLPMTVAGRSKQARRSSRPLVTSAGWPARLRCHRRWGMAITREFFDASGLKFISVTGCRAPGRNSDRRAFDRCLHPRE